MLLPNTPNKIRAVISAKSDKNKIILQLGNTVKKSDKNKIILQLGNTVKKSDITKYPKPQAYIFRYINHQGANKNAHQFHELFLFCNVISENFCE